MSQPVPPPVPQYVAVSTAPSRPWNVTLVAVLGILLTISGLVTSVLAIIASTSASARAEIDASGSAILAFGVVGALWAIIMFILWLKFLKGSRASRAWLAFFVVLHIVFSVVSAISISGGAAGIASVLVISAFEIVVLFLMFGGERTKAFFAKRA